jgi:hypothetical protein
VVKSDIPNLNGCAELMDARIDMEKAEKAMHKLAKLWVVGAFALMGIGASTFPAAATPILGIDYTSAQSAACNHSCIDGYEFTVNSPITVTALGVFDGAQGNPSGQGSPLNISPADTVDLFNSSGTILESLSVGTGGTQVGKYWDFVNLASPIILAPGNYIVASTISNGDLDASFAPENASLGSNITFDQEESCTNITGQFNGSSCTLSTASLVAGDNHLVNSSLGGNIEYTVSAPEPGSLAILGTALVGLGLWRRRKKSANSEGAG